MAPLLAGRSQAAAGELRQCDTCGAPTTGEECAFCRLKDRVSGHDPVPVDLVLNKKARKAYLAARAAGE